MYVRLFHGLSDKLINPEKHAENFEIVVNKENREGRRKLCIHNNIRENLRVGFPHTACHSLTPRTIGSAGGVEERRSTSEGDVCGVRCSEISTL